MSQKSTNHEFYLSQYRALERSADDVRFDQTAAWFEAFIENVVEHSSNVVAAIAEKPEQTEPLAIAFLVFNKSHGHFFSKKEILSLSNYYTSLFEPLLGQSESHFEGSACYFVTKLVADFHKPDIIDFSPLDETSVFYGSLISGLRDFGYLVEPYFKFHNWYLDVAGQSFDGYYQSLPTRLRSTIERKRRKLDIEQGYKISLFKHDGIDKAIIDYENIYQKSWKTTESHPCFIRAIVQCFAACGWLRLGILYVNNTPAAAQIWFVKDGIASIFKLAYDKQYAKYSVGSLLMAEMMVQVLDRDKVQEVDFLAGNEAYKKDWMSHCRERWGVRAYNMRTINGFTGGLLSVSKRVIKQFIRKP